MKSCHCEYRILQSKAIMSTSWILWSICAWLVYESVSLALSELPILEYLPRGGKTRRELERVCRTLRDLEECLEAGILPERSRWEELKALDAPWGGLAMESVEEIRKSGGAVLPTLKRLRALATAQKVTLAEAQARSSQALAQAAVCVLLVPLLGSVLSLLLPGVDERPALWLAICGAAMIAASAGAQWLVALADSARWAGIRRERRSWMLAAQCAGERFLALVRCGQPADLAWSRAMDALRREAPDLAEIWGSSVFAPEMPEKARGGVGAEAVLAGIGLTLRRAIHASLMEGRPCSERVETAFESLRTDLRAAVERELTLLGTRSLKPLFLCVAPALLGMLGGGMAIGFISAMHEGPWS